MDAIYVGIDVSKDRLDVHVRPSGEAFAVARDGKGLEELLRACGDLAGADCGGGDRRLRDHRRLRRWRARQLPLVVVNPAQVRHFAQAVGQACQDRPDRCGGDRPVRRGREARAAAAAGSGRPGCWLNWSARRRQIIEMIVAERQREKRAENAASARASPAISRPSRRNSRRSTTTSTRWCAARRSGATRRNCWSAFPASATPRADAARRAARTRQHSIGARSRASPVLRRSPASPADGRARASSAAAAPACAPPSSWPPCRPSATTRRSRPSIDACVAAGKPKMVALIAVARKLLTILNAMLRDQKPWQPA